MKVDIYSIPLDRLTKISPDFTENFFNELFKALPSIGKVHEKYWLINNNLTLQNPTNLAIITLFNIFVQLSQRKCTYLQITKTNL